MYFHCGWPGYWESWEIWPQSLSLPGHGSLQKICEQSSGERSFSRCLDETVGFVIAQVKGEGFISIRGGRPSSAVFQLWAELVWLFRFSFGWEARVFWVIQKHPIVWASLTHASAQLMCPFAVEWQLGAWPISVAAVSGRDSCSVATRYGELREVG